VNQTRFALPTPDTSVWKAPVLDARESCCPDMAFSAGGRSSSRGDWLGLCFERFAARKSIRHRTSAVARTRIDEAILRDGESAYGWLRLHPRMDRGG